MKRIRSAALATILAAGLAATGCAPATHSKAAAPASPTALAFPEGEAFRAKQPAPDEIAPFEQPGIQRFTLKNGIEVYLVEQHELPTVSMQLVFPGGSVDDPKGKEGLASMCVGLMSDGTAKLDKIAFNEALADLASSVSSGAGLDEQYVAMATLTKNLDETLALFADTLLRPGMRQEELDRSVKQRLESLKQIKGSPDSIASRIDGTILWGPEHAYGRFYTEESTAQIGLNDCKKHIASFFKPKGAKLYVVGDITKAQIEEKLGLHLAGWTGAPKKSSAIAKAKPREGKVFLVDVPGAQQSVVRVLHPGPTRTAEDFVPTNLMSTILGGGFSSRINMNIREDKGYAYGAYGGFSYFRDAGLFTAGGSVRADATAKSLVEILKEMKRIRTEPVTEAELAREKEGAVLSLPARWATGGQILGTYKGLVYYGLPLDWYEGYVPSVQKVSIEDVKKAAERHVKPEDVRVLVVGDAKTVLPELKEVAKNELGVSEIVRLDADGKVVK